MNLRRDAFLAAGRFGLAARESAIDRGGVATIGTVTAEPGIPTIINQRCEVTLDQRAFKPEQLRDMLADVKAAADADRRGGGRDGRVEADLADRPDPVRRDASSTSPRRRSARSPATTTRRGCRPARCTTPPRSRAAHPTVMVFSS